MSNLNYEVIDNFLDPESFQSLKKELKGISWYYNALVSDPEDENSERHFNWYFTHLVYHHVQNSSYYEILNSMFREKLNVKTWIRIKFNFYPYTSILQEHSSHSDCPYSHKAAVFSLNTCDGYTKVPNGDIVRSVENRIVLFDGYENHSSTTTSNSKCRININFNWF